MSNDKLPRPFGSYLLTAALPEDALGRQYRALRAGTEEFVRVRILDSPELPGEALLVAIEENGEVHGFLKNPAVARGVDMDAVDGVPYVAWSDPNGRTLADLHVKTRSIGRRLPVEHALLIAEKVATALDHAYNTTIDGDRTLHGLVWPGLVAISDDGEIRLAGFGLAPGILPSIAKPRLAREVGPYVAPEARASGEAARNSDVFSVGALLYEMLTGQAPGPDPLGSLKGGGAGAPPIVPEMLAVLRMTLGPADSRYKSAGDLRRELGKLLFSGPYSPSTFNLAYFLNDLFREEIETETRARKRELALSGASGGGDRAPTPFGPADAVPPRAAPEPERPPATAPGILVAPAEPTRRGPLALVGGVLAAAAVAGGIYVVSRRSPDSSSAAKGPARVTTVAPTPTFLPEFQPTPVGPTTGMTEEQFRDEVSRRVALETQRIEAQIKARQAPTPGRLGGGFVARPTASIEVIPAPAPTNTPPPAVAVAPAVAPAAAPPTEAPRPSPVPPLAPAAAAAVKPGSLVPFEELDTPPRIATVVKPGYPPLELKARIGGIVVLRVLVSEKGAPVEVAVMRGARAGLDQAAIAAVRKWTFTPAVKDGVPVRTWMTVPIPFEP